jgi:hypothetical protein
MSLDALRAHLRDLEAKGRLERQLAARDDAMPWSDLLWLLQIPAFAGVAIHVVRMANAASATGDGPPRGDFLWFVALALVAIALNRGHRFARTPAQHLRQRLREDGVLAAAAIVQVNQAFWQDGNDQWLPGSVLLCFDPAAWQQPARLTAAAERLFALRDQDRSALPPEHGALAWDLYHSLWPVASTRVPSDLCDGLRDCWLATVTFPPEPLQQHGLLVALALPGEASPHAVALLPRALATDGGA